MLKPVNRIKERLTDSTRSFKERVFILLTLVTDFVAVLALVGDIAFGENIVEIIALAITIILVPIVTLVSVRLKKVSAAAMIVVFGLVFVLLPILFYFGGGVEGGGVLWIIFSYLYAGLVLTGKWKVFFLIVLSIESCGFYLHAYFKPHLIKQHSRREFYTDSLISIIMVGVICCMMVWFEEWMYAEENKRAKEETDKVDEMRRAQSRFFSSMSHEIRTPINSILGLNEIILRQEDASEEIVKDAENIQGAGRMLLALVNDILDLSKIEADKMEIVPVSYNLGNVISEIVSMIWLLAEQKGLELKVEVDPDTPSALFGDEVRIKQILVNLLNNAIKYTKEGTVTLHIQTEECLLSHLPETKVFKNEGADELIARMNTSDTYSKKLSVVVATNSMCDLPESVIKNCGIDVIPFRLSSDGKTYFDRVEANTDELARYVREGDEFDISPPSVKDFEEFFAREIKKAHHVIYISLAGSVSHEYTNALEAAREYGNVTIFQSGLNSSAMGMLSLYAYKLSTQGRTTEQIINALEIMRRSLRCTFMTDDVIFFSRRRMFSKGIYSFLHLFSFKPVISLNDNKLAVKRFFVGELSACHERYISVALPKRANPDLDVCFVSYASLSEEERERIEKAIRKHHNFNRIVFQKISGANALSCGTEAYGISYMKKNSLTPGLSSLLVTEAAPRLSMMDTEPSEPVHDHSLKKEEKKKEKKWYEDIPEIDAQVALEYCRSEDDLKGVLKTYCASINSRADEIERYYKAEDWENYIIKVHAMKSSSKLVGAMQLSEDARVLEFAGKENNIDLIREKTDKLLNDFREFKTVLEPYVFDEAPQAETADFDRNSISELLDKLEEAMNELDLDIADSVIDKLYGYAGSDDYTAKLELIKAAVINVDDEEAIKLIEEMRKML